jgi:hypothetical protein
MRKLNFYFIRFVGHREFFSIELKTQKQRGIQIQI